MHPKGQSLNLKNAMAERISSLYQRLGGYDTIAAFIDETYQRLRDDPMFSRFSTRSTSSRERARQLLVDQICHLAGGPCLYIGRDMKTSHAGLRISGAEWDASIEHTRQAMKNHNVGAHQADEVITIIQKYRADIVEM